MYDASAKFPSGILNGNINQFGDFDQCLRAADKNDMFRGQYCLTTIQLTLPKGENYLNSLRRLVLSNEPFASKIDDTRTFIPKTSEVYWGLCVPSSCSNEEVSNALKSFISIKTNISEFFWKVKAKDGMCQIKDKHWSLNRGEKSAL